MLGPLSFSCAGLTLPSPWPNYNERGGTSLLAYSLQTISEKETDDTTRMDGWQQRKQSRNAEQKRKKKGASTGC